MVIYQSVMEGEYCDMEIRDIRRANLKALMDHYFEPGSRGQQSRFGELLGKPQNLISRLLMDPEKKGSKTVGEDLARDIEASLGLDRYAIDDPELPRRLAGLVTKEKESNVIAADFSSKKTGMVDIPRLNVAGSMGSGLARPEDYEDVIDRMRVSAGWLRRNVNATAPSNLAVITGYGDSMEGTFSDGDLLLVDRGVTEIKIDAVYVLSLKGELYIKRLQRRPDGVLLMLSDNEKYKPYEIKNGELEQFEVLGRVLLAWNAKRL